jgi:Thioredoxin like C-terminal domain/AhpC/TSA family
MGGIFGLGSRLSLEGRFPPMDGATGWLNSPALTPHALRGKVVAIDFCTYTCINWLRTLPYVRAWSETYADQGLVVIGVHTPEFSFEHDPENARRALAEMHVEFPIALDSDYAVWNAFTNHYWPALYLIDAGGRIRHHRFGEGDYERSEKMIQQLLTDAGAEHADREIADVVGTGPEAPADWEQLESPETYVGFRQARSFASPGGIAAEQSRVYQVPDRLAPNEWALSGEWTIGPESAVSRAPDARIAFRFHARDVHLVMGPADPGSAIGFRVFVDGRPATDAHGSDVGADGTGKLDFPRMYQLIRQRGSIESRLFEIEFEAPGAEVFCFTFG